MDFDSMTRVEIVQYLESWGYACYDSDSDDELREAAKLNYETEDDSDE